MKMQAMSFLLSLTMAIPATWADPIAAETLGQEQQAELLKLTSGVAQNWFHIQSLKRNIENSQMQLSQLEAGVSGITEEDVYKGIAALSVAASLYLAYKAKTVAGGASFFSAAGSLGSGILGLSAGFKAWEARIQAQLKLKGEKRQLRAALESARVELISYEQEAESNLKRLEKIDPNIRAKVANAVKAGSESLERFESLRAQINEAEDDLTQEGAKIGGSFFMLGSSVYGLLKYSRRESLSSAMSGRSYKTDIVLRAASTLIFSGLIAKGFYDLNQLSEQIKILKGSLGEIEASYKQDFIEALAVR